MFQLTKWKKKFQRVQHCKGWGLIRLDLRAKNSSRGRLATSVTLLSSHWKRWVQTLQFGPPIHLPDKIRYVVYLLSVDDKQRSFDSSGRCEDIAYLVAFSQLVEASKCMTYITFSDLLCYTAGVSLSIEGGGGWELHDCQDWICAYSWINDMDVRRP